MEKNIAKIVGSNLTALRKSAGMKQIEIAKKFNFSDKTISKWESGESLPSLDVLVKLCEFYGITLNDLTSESLDCTDAANIIPVNAKIENTNKIIITLLAVTLVWIIATIVFIYAKLYTNVNLWIAFIWAVPVSFIVGIVLNSIWGKRKINFILISFFVWTLLTAIYLQILEYNLWVVFILGIPSQIAIILWSGLKSNKKKN